MTTYEFRTLYLPRGTSRSAALRILTGRIRAVAGLALATVLVLAVFSTWFLLIPLVAAAASLAMRRSLTRGAAQMSSLRTTST